MLLDHSPGIDDIPPRLGHLLPLGVQHELVHYDVTIGKLIERSGGDGQERVKPSAGLIDSLTDEVSRKVPTKFLLVLERIMPLGIRHRSGVEPGVNHFRAAAHQSAAAACPCVLVDERLMWVESLRQRPAPTLPQLGIT